MRSAIIFVLFSIIVIALAARLPPLKDDQPIINRRMIEQINSNPESTWVAGSSERLKDVTVRDFKKLLGVIPSSEQLPEKEIEVAQAIPDSFDARTAWKGCIGPVLDQGGCGSCWAFGAVEGLEYRFCIKSNGTKKVDLSEQDLVSCDNSNGGCNGGEPGSAWNYMKQSGVVTTSCYPYEMGTCTHPGCPEKPTPACNKTCADGKGWEASKYYAATAYSISGKVEAIQTEIMTNGPVEVTMAVYEDFAHYSSGVYVHTSGALLGYHAVLNVGWGVDKTSNTPYWIIQNSWNPTWGMEGYFLIRRGTNEVGIESSITAGEPKL